MTLLKDIHNRQFKKLRISLINSCNLGCVYCTLGEEGQDNVQQPKSKYPISQLLSKVSDLHAQLNLESVRLTGGEPLLHPSLFPIVKGISEIGIRDITLTTNGLLLARKAAGLKEAGLISANISLDAMDEDVFYSMSKRKGVHKVLEGIEAALACGIKVKLNTVLMKGINDNQIFPLLEYAFERNITIRFLEVMAMGHLYKTAQQYLFLQEDLLELIASRYSISKLTRSQSSTANYWETPSGNKFGIIANESEPFCHDCNRLRLDSHGNIYGCLSNNNPISIKKVTGGDELISRLQLAMNQKQQMKFTGSKLSMLEIGG